MTTKTIHTNYFQLPSTFIEARNHLEEIFQPSLWTRQNLKESDAHFRQVIQILTQFPVLAQKKFEFGSTRVLPLSLILLSRTKVTLDTVKQVYQLYPDAIHKVGLYYAERPDFTYYPLYLACLESCQDEIIQFLAAHLEDNHYYPECLAMFRKLYQIKKGQRYLSLTATQILLAKYPDLTTVEYSGGKILDLAFQSGYSLDILIYILDKTPIKSITIKAPSSLKDNRISLLRQHLMPNLTTLGWITNSISGLPLLQDCLQFNTNITSLQLEVRTPTDSSIENRTITDTMSTILSNDHLHCLSVETTTHAFDVQELVSILPHNRNLHILSLDPPISDLKPMNTLLGVLETDNIGLHQLSVHERLHKYASYKKIVYYLLLNQCGRGKARDPHTPMADFVQLLMDTQEQGKLNQFRLWYGLLRELPSLWCEVK
jgi:hypothetical protein